MCSHGFLDQLTAFPNDTHTHTHTQTLSHTHTHKHLLCSPGLVAPPQVVDVDHQATFIITDHFPDLTLVNPLVLLPETDIKRFLSVKIKSL